MTMVIFISQAAGPLHCTTIAHRQSTLSFHPSARDMPQSASVEAPVPRVAIQFCIECKWNLRAAYYAQELLQTFSTSLGEVSLRPATGGVFTVTLETLNEGSSALESHLLWDRKRDGGFPETKELKVTGPLYSVPLTIAIANCDRNNA
ncbi:hypothetical protein TWF696_004334 [Orbilia brochopaga]|uniref:Uncharacterized protein n=1 Tax=Orbilia brochopaga TaxID=3140254 RepID=A0AAV9V8K4_9PEZI